MPDLPNRDGHEKTLAGSLALTFQKYLGQVQSYLDPDNPDLADIPADFWTEFGAALREDLQSGLPPAYADGAVTVQQTLATSFPELKILNTVDWNLVNEDAAAWAKEYTYELVKGINTTTQDFLRDKISSFFSDGKTMGELRDEIETMFSPIRAEMIATTEVTRASVYGELATVNELEADSSLNLIPTFQTSEDEYVCDECGPLDGKQVESDDYPPIHPRCRCWINWVPEGWDD